MIRKALKDFAFSDGTFVPSGSWLGVAGYPTHHYEVSIARGPLELILTFNLSE